MGWFAKLFGKKESPQVELSHMDEKDRKRAEELAGRIYDRLNQNTAQPIVRLTLTKGEPGVLHSKVGGAYYVPAGMKPPVDHVTGRPLFLLAQLNFAQLPAIEDFPKQGLLQFFIAGDDLYGCDFDHADTQASWRIRYLESLPEEHDIGEGQVLEPEIGKEDMLPLPEREVYALTGEKAMQAVTTSDFRFDSYLKQYCSDLTGPGVSGFYDLDDNICDALYDLLVSPACQIGGYPCFTQSDPRENSGEGEEVPLVLFQLDTVEDIMWGDSGVGNFFIYREDLKKRDFSRVLYNWDCC